MRTLENLPFDNAFARLPEQFYTRLAPDPLPEPVLVAASPAAAAPSTTLRLGPLMASSGSG